MGTDTYELIGNGIVNSTLKTFPNAKLKVTNQFLHLEFSKEEKFVFLPQDIISIQPLSHSSHSGRGIRIKHRILNYCKGEDLIFSTSVGPEMVIDKINQTGFFDNVYSKATEHIIKTVRQKQNESVRNIFKMRAIYVVIGFVNLVFFVDVIIWNINGRKQFGVFMLAAIGLVFIGTLITLYSKKVSALVLEEGVRLEDAKKRLYLCLLYCVVGFLFFLIVGSVQH